MKITDKILATVVIIGMAGCTTPYQPNGFSGGYTETQLDDNVFVVRFGGNGYTSVDTAEKYALLRSAELTLERGYAYFQIVDGNTRIRSSTRTTPVTTQTYGSVYGNYGSATSYTTGGHAYTISKPSTKNTIVLFKERPTDGFSYNAKFIYAQYKNSVAKQAEQTEKLRKRKLAGCAPSVTGGYPAWCEEAKE